MYSRQSSDECVHVALLLFKVMLSEKGSKPEVATRAGDWYNVLSMSSKIHLNSLPTFSHIEN